MDGAGLLDEMDFDAGLDDFYSGTGQTINLQPQPKSAGNDVESGGVPQMGIESGAPASEGDGGNGAAALAAASAAAAAAGAIGSALLGGKLGQAQELMGESVNGAVAKAALAAVPTSLQPMKESASQYLQKAQPWKQFFWPLSIPAAADGCSRITANIYTFQTNYAIGFVLFMAFSILFQPSQMVCIACTVAAWVMFLKKNDDPEWKPSFNGRELGPVQRWLALVFVSMVVLWLGGAGALIINSSLLYMCLVVAHGLLHDTTPKELPGANAPPIPL